MFCRRKCRISSKYRWKCTSLVFAEPSKGAERKVAASSSVGICRLFCSGTTFGLFQTIRFVPAYSATRVGSNSPTLDGLRIPTESSIAFVSASKSSQNPATLQVSRDGDATDVVIEVDRRTHCDHQFMNCVFYFYFRMDIWDVLSCGFYDIIVSKLGKHSNLSGLNWTLLVASNRKWFWGLFAVFAHHVIVLSFRLGFSMFKTFMSLFGLGFVVLCN